MANYELTLDDILLTQIIIGFPYYCDDLVAILVPAKYKTVTKTQVRGLPVLYSPQVNDITYVNKKEFKKYTQIINTKLWKLFFDN